MASPTEILNVRYEVGDTDVGLPIMSDLEYDYFITKNNGSINRAALDCARAILLKLSIRSEDSSVDIFSIKGSKAAEAYRNALILYVTNPSLNKVLDSVGVYFGGVSKEDYLANLNAPDNLIFDTPSDSVEQPQQTVFEY